MMSVKSCLMERFSALSIGVFLLIGAVGLGIISLVALPVIGLVLAIPVLALSLYFFRVHFNRQCQIDVQ
jgi:hypothetical protein